MKDRFNMLDVRPGRSQWTWCSRYSWWMLRRVGGLLTLGLLCVSVATAEASSSEAAAREPSSSSSSASSAGVETSTDAPSDGAASQVGGPASRDSSVAARDRAALREGRRGRGRGGARSGRPLPGLEMPILRELFAPAVTDTAPLAPEERERLVKFAQTQVPMLGRMISVLQRRAPEQFERRFEQLAPRLRRLERVFNEDAELGRMLVEYVSTDQRLKRWMRVAGRRFDSASQSERIRSKIEEFQTTLVGLECAILERRLPQLRSAFDAHVDAKLAYLLSDAAIEQQVPMAALDLVAVATSDDPDRELARSELRVLIAEQTERDVERAEQQLTRVCGDAEAEIARRLELSLKRIEAGADAGSGGRGPRGSRGD